MKKREKNFVFVAFQSYREKINIKYLIYIIKKYIYIHVLNAYSYKK